MAKAIDCGTMFLVKGEVGSDNQPVFTVERNVFLEAASTDDTAETLKENNWSYAQYGDEYYILGEDAIKIKNLLTVNSSDRNIVMTQVGELRRPMKDGILNTGEEKLSVAIIQKLIANLVGKPVSKGEILCFCTPGNPIDKNLTIVFHRIMLTNFLKSLGYEVECIPEALAIIFSERPVAEDPEEGEAPFSGIAFSFGAGMCNICIKGDTKISLLNGENISIEELSRTHADKEFWVYSCDENGQIVPGKAYAPRLTQKNTKVVKVTLDNGKIFECTSNHKIMLRDGLYKEAGQLKVNDSLMPLYRDVYSYPNSSSKYEMVKNNKTGRWNKTHRLVATQITGEQIRRGYVVHHKDFNPRNTPWNKGISGDKARFKNGFKNQYNHKVLKVEVVIKPCDVYDLSVEKYHNFAINSGVFVHNCMAWKKLPLINFSVAQSGDWIDQEAAKTAGINTAAMTRYKEKNFSLENADYSDMRQAALDIFYQNMIEHALNNFAEKFNQLDNQIEAPLEIIVAGGTSIVPGFMKKFESVIEGLTLPFKIRGLQHAENPFYTVANGCLLKAMASENKRAEKIVENMGTKETKDKDSRKIKVPSRK